MLARAALGVSAALAAVDVPLVEITAGVQMPSISIGTGGQEMSAASEITTAWLSQGGRGLDAAYGYNNEEAVAEAIEASGLARADLFITSKIPGCDDAENYIKANLEKLKTDYLDLLLVHFPRGDCAKGWQVLEQYHADGVLKAIGISNFERTHIESLMKTAKVVPHVNQFQLNVLEHDDDQIAASQQHAIKVESFSPLGRSGSSGDISGNPTIQKIATAHNVSTYQVAIRWIIQKGHLLTFQSSNAAHQASDADVFNFSLTTSDMDELDRLQSQQVQV
jgi:2,5-diketo-D-gluconate reductase A